jgi:hypothetical protein
VLVFVGGADNPATHAWVPSPVAAYMLERVVRNWGHVVTMVRDSWYFQDRVLETWPEEPDLPWLVKVFFSQLTGWYWAGPHANFVNNPLDPRVLWVKNVAKRQEQSDAYALIALNAALKRGFILPVTNSKKQHAQKSAATIVHYPSDFADKVLAAYEEHSPDVIADVFASLAKEQEKLDDAKVSSPPAAVTPVPEIAAGRPTAIAGGSEGPGRRNGLGGAAEGRGGRSSPAGPPALAQSAQWPRHGRGQDFASARRDNRGDPANGPETDVPAADLGPVEGAGSSAAQGPKAGTPRMS